MYDMEQDIDILSAKEQTALSQILVSSKSQDGIPKIEIMKKLGTIRDEKEFERFLLKVNRMMKGAMKIVYDENSDRCVALARASSDYLMKKIFTEPKLLALLLFCFYLGITSQSGKMTLDELLQYFQQSDLSASHVLQVNLTVLEKLGFLVKIEENINGAKRKAYYLTESCKSAFPEKYLQKVVSMSQGGEVSLEQVRSFFAMDRNEETELEETVQLKII